MASRYTIRALEPKGQLSDEMSLVKVIRELNKRIDGKGPHALEFGGERHKQDNSTADVKARVNDLMRQAHGPDRILVHPSRSRSQAIRKLQVPDHEIVNTEGTDAVDRIWTGLTVKFSEQWLVRNMGIYVAKPGQHGKRNAVDAGTNVNIPAQETWDRILAMAGFLKREGMKHAASGGRYGIPVYGIIVMSKYWMRGSATWRSYDGVPHVSHLHASGYPSLAPGWI